MVLEGSDFNRSVFKGTKENREGSTGGLTNERVGRFILTGAHPQAVLFNAALRRENRACFVPFVYMHFQPFYSPCKSLYLS